MNTNQTLIAQIVDFYSQYLSCSPEQLDLLALWTLHTHTFPSAPFSPSLYIHSRQKQSGKTLCLELLSLLCDDAWMHTAPTPSLLLQQLADPNHEFTGTLLLDDCHATLGSSRMNLKLHGLLTASFKQDGRYIVRFLDRDGYAFDWVRVFFPTAFAGNGRLPACLADLSIPIALEPKRPVLRCQPKDPGSACRPFRFYLAQESTKPLRQSLSLWGADTHELFSKIAPYKDDQFPPELSFRQRDCAEPLLQIADFIGGEWPQRARQALVNAFALAAFEDFYSSRQILADLCDAFADKGNPGWISTADLLAFLHTMEDRTWDDWSKGKPMKPKDLAGLLAPFGIHSHNHRTSPDKVIKGYNLEDFQKSWNQHLPQTCGTEALGYERSAVAAQFAEVTNNQVMDSTCSVVAADTQNPSTSISGQQPVASGQKLAASGSAVAADTQNPSTNIPGQQPVASGQKLAASSSAVAADTQNPSTSIPGQKPVASNQKLAASGSAVAAKSAKFTNNPAIGPLGRVAARNLRRVTSNLEWLGTKG